MAFSRPGKGPTYQEAIISRPRPAQVIINGPPLGYTAENVANKDTDGTLAADSDTNYASQKATKAYVDTAVAALGLTANTTYYVRTDGSDSNDGLTDASGGAFATIQKAVSTVAKLNLGGHTATIQVRAGTYTAGFSQQVPFINGSVIIKGDTSTPANVFINVSLGDAIALTGVTCTVQGFKLATSAGKGLNIQNSFVTLGAMEYGQCTSGHIIATNGSAVAVNAGYTISGLASFHVSASQGSQIIYGAMTVTLSGTPGFLSAFAFVADSSVIDFGTSVTFTGAATGTRYVINDVSAIRAGSLFDFDAYLPGDASGFYAPRADGNRSFRNLLFNAAGRLQKGPSGTVADDTYGLHNRWYALTQTGAITPSTLVDVQDGVPHMIRLTNTLGSGQRIGYTQILEGSNCKHLHGQMVSLSGWLRLSSAATVRFAVLEWQGIENAVTSDVVNDWTNGTFTTGNFFIAGGLVVAGAGSKNLSANTMATFQLVQVQLSSVFNNLIVLVWTNGLLAASTGTLDLRVQLESGGAATGFEHRPVSAEERLCERYYQSKTVQSENGARHIPLIGLRATPTVAVGVGSAGNITPDGFELTHTTAASCSVVASAEL